MCTDFGRWPLDGPLLRKILDSPLVRLALHHKHSVLSHIIHLHQLSGVLNLVLGVFNTFQPFLLSDDSSDGQSISVLFFFFFSHILIHPALSFKQMDFFLFFFLNCQPFQRSVWDHLIF